MSVSFDISGKTALVTGCSTGIGHRIALGLAQAGANIVGVDYVDAQEYREGNTKNRTRISGDQGESDEDWTS